MLQESRLCFFMCKILKIPTKKSSETLITDLKVCKAHAGFHLVCETVIIIPESPEKHLFWRERQSTETNRPKKTGAPAHLRENWKWVRTYESRQKYLSNLDNSFLHNLILLSSKSTEILEWSCYLLCLISLLSATMMFSASTTMTFPSRGPTAKLSKLTSRR